MGNSGGIWGRIDKILDAKGISLTDLCEGTGLNYKSIKSQRSRIDLSKLDDAVKIARFLNVSIDFIATGEEAEAFSEEAILVEHDDKLKAVVRACERNPHLLEVIAVTVESMEQVARA